jgi:hypothetical protein
MVICKKALLAKLFEILLVSLLLELFDHFIGYLVIILALRYWEWI